MKDNRIKMRAWNGIIKNLYYDYRVAFKVGFIISAVIVISMFIVNTIAIGIDGSVSGKSNGGAMNFTAMTALITILVSSIDLTSKKGLESKFFFPLNKMVWSLANFVMMAFAAFVFTTMSLALTAIEMILSNILSANSAHFLFVSNFSLYEYTGGTITLFMYILVWGSIVYCLFMYFRKYLIVSLVGFTLLIIFPIIRGGQLYVHVINFFVLEDVILFFILKFLALTLLLHGLAYLPFRKMEVVK